MIRWRFAGWLVLFATSFVSADAPSTRPFDYKPGAADASIYDTKPDGAMLRQRLTIAGAGQERIPLVLTIPAQGKQPFPVALLLHGAYGDRKENPSRAMAGRLAKYGIASIAIDLPGHGQRQGKDHADFRNALGYLLSQRIAPQVPLAPMLPAAQREAIAAVAPKAVSLVADGLADCVIDCRRVIDYVATREDLDAKRVAVYGQSMGGALGFWLTAGDVRVRATVMAIAGAFEMPADAENAPLRAYYDPAVLKTYAAAVTPRPVLMLSSRTDPIVRPADTNRLFDSLQEPKRIEWYESGHNLPRPALDLAAQWLAKQLGIDTPLTTQPATQPTK